MVRSSDLVRFTWLGLVSYGLTSVVLRLFKQWPGVGTTPFFYFLAGVAAAKVIADGFYFTAFPRYREWGQLDDYLINDFGTFFRFGFPLVLVQAYMLNKGMVPVPYLSLWLSPAAAVLLVLVNRWLIERAADRRRARRGGIPAVRGRDDS